MAPSKSASVPAGARGKWSTALTCIEPNRILVRGYRLDDLMGRVHFGEAVYLLLTGELPTPSMGRLMDAMLVSFIDHGATPPSTLAARNTATTGASLRGSVAAGVAELRGTDAQAVQLRDVHFAVRLPHELGEVREAAAVLELHERSAVRDLPRLAAPPHA